MDVTCRIGLVGELSTLHVHGEIDLASLPTLRDAVVRLVTSAPGTLVAVDLDGVTVIDDAGLGVLLGGAARARDAGGDLVLVCTSPKLLAWFDLSGLSRAVEVRNRLT